MTLLKSEVIVTDRTPLLRHRSLSDPCQTYETLEGRDDDEPEIQEVQLEKHINLLHATGIMIGTVCGTGIFISPTGVTQSVGSVGMSLVVWCVGGLFSLVLALCYAEIGSAIPLAGGDYAYIQRVMGPGSAFLCLWAVLVLIASACALTARSAALYFLQMFNMECNTVAFNFVGCIMHLGFAYLNARTTKWSTKILNILSLGKIFAMVMIIISGVVSLAANGSVQTDSAFTNTNWSASGIAVGFVASFITFCGWDSAIAVAGEMKNPKRDLPIALISSLAIVTTIYVLINAAYFAVLTVDEFVSSDAVALTFAMKALPQVPWLVPVVVCMASAGSINVTYLIGPRYLYAGGKDGQLPEVLSLLHHEWMTPIPGIIFMVILSVALTCATFINIQGLIQILGILLLIKISMTLICTLRLKWTHPHIERSITVPWVVVAVCQIILLAIIGLTIYEQPYQNGLGLAIFLLGIPLCLIGRFCSKQPWCNRVMAHITKVTQKVCMVVS